MHEREATFLKATLNYNKGFCKVRAETSNAPSKKYLLANSRTLLTKRSVECCCAMINTGAIWFKDKQWL